MKEKEIEDAYALKLISEQVIKQTLNDLQGLIPYEISGVHITVQSFNNSNRIITEVKICLQ